jgi:hypothetical protein
MEFLLFTIFFLLAVAFIVPFIRGPYKHSPLWLMLAAWMAAIGIPRLHLSKIEVDWTGRFIFLIALSLNFFILGFWLTKKYFTKNEFWKVKDHEIARSPVTGISLRDDEAISTNYNQTKIKETATALGRTQASRFRNTLVRFLNRDYISTNKLRYTIYVLFFLSLVGLYLFYKKVGNFPLLAPSPDVFRFTADEKSPGLVNYAAQLARLFVPLSFYLFFYEGFSFKKHWDLCVLSLIGAISLTLFASRTQIYMIDLWIMALYLVMKKPNLKQAIKFYPAFL